MHVLQAAMMQPNLDRNANLAALYTLPDLLGKAGSELAVAVEQS